MESRHATQPRLSIEETVALAEAFWAGSPYIQQINPDKAKFLEAVRAMRARELRLPVAREAGREVEKRTRVQSA